MEKIEIGAVAKPQGIKGELKIRLFADDFNQVKKVKKIFIDEISYDVKSFISSGKEEAIVKLNGVDDRNFAETLRQKPIYALKEELGLKKGSYFISDVLGSSLILSSGKVLGEIYDIVKGNVDYYYVKIEGKTAVFPLLKDLLIYIDIEKKEVKVDAKKFTEVVLYEN